MLKQFWCILSRKAVMKSLLFIWTTVSDGQEKKTIAKNILRKRHFTFCHVTKNLTILGVLWQPCPGDSTLRHFKGKEGSQMSSSPQYPLLLTPYEKLLQALPAIGVKEVWSVPVLKTLNAGKVINNWKVSLFWSDASKALAKQEGKSARVRK